MATQESKAQAVFKKALAATAEARSEGMCVRLVIASVRGGITGEEASLARAAIREYLQKLGASTGMFLYDALRQHRLTDLPYAQWREYGLAAFYATWDKRPRPWRKGQRPVAAILKLAVDSGVYPGRKQYMCHAVQEMYNEGRITSRERERTLQAIQQYLATLGEAQLGYTPLTLRTAMRALGFSIESFHEYIGCDLYRNWRDRPVHRDEVREVVQVAMRRHEADRARESAEEE